VLRVEPGLLAPKALTYAVMRDVRAHLPRRLLQEFVRLHEAVLKR
jgi:hypothetical protein